MPRVQDGSREVHVAQLGCFDLFCEGDPAGVEEQYQMVWKGEGQGSYAAASYKEFEKGGWEKEVVSRQYSSYRPRQCCLCLLALLLLSLLGFFLYYLLHMQHAAATGADESTGGSAQSMIDCATGYGNFEELWDEDRKAICCDLYGRGCARYHKHQAVVTHVVHHHHTVVYHHPQVVHHYTKYNCHAGYSNWYFGWSHHKKAWCCHHESRGCPGTWHGSYHLHTHVEHGVGHAHGHIYDCEAGYSNWMQGWSDSKKDWCCNHEKKGCVKYHCTGHVSHWSDDKADWCCANFQKGCPETTLSPMKCETPCTLKGQTSTCLSRIHWTADNVFAGKAEKCALAYSKVQVECDVCRSCSIEETGCEVHSVGSLPFDCNAALNNFFRAWSPEKKHWCCTKQGKGCEGHHPPAVDAGYGMVWKHVQVNGYWTWVAVHGHGHFSLPYDCHAGLANWHTGWSAGKKGWCCAHQQLGCDGGGGGGHVVVVHGHGGGYYSHAHPPGPAGSGMVWHWSTSGGQGHWVQIHNSGHLPFDCSAGFARWRTGWSPAKKDWCCHHVGNSCA